jgi:hypothetical protein
VPRPGASVLGGPADEKLAHDHVKLAHDHVKLALAT